MISNIKYTITNFLDQMIYLAMCWTICQSKERSSPASQCLPPFQHHCYRWCTIWFTRRQAWQTLPPLFILVLADSECFSCLMPSLSSSSDCSTTWHVSLFLTRMQVHIVSPCYRFVEKGNLEIMLFTLQSQMRANNQKPYLPKDGKLISDINKAWEALERAEHERELALREELIR